MCSLEDIQTYISDMKGLREIHYRGQNSIAGCQENIITYP